MIDIYENVPVVIEQNREELSSLAELVCNMTSFLEIGSRYGGTLWVWLKLLSSKGNAFVVDKVEDSKSQWTSWLREEQTLDTIYEDSHEQKTLGVLQSHMTERGVSKLDFLFIDGDHTYSGVKKDYEMYSPLVKEGGIIAFHDIVRSTILGTDALNVHGFWKEIKIGKTYKEFIADSSSYGIGIIIK